MKLGVKEVNIKEAKLFSKGKVREIYDDGDSLIMIATDRISAFDVILPDPIPGKGIVLTQISIFWFDFLKDIVPNHFITDRIEEMGEPYINYKDIIEYRTIKVKKLKRLDVECIVRGYIEGSGWKDYQKTGMVSGIKLPPGLKRGDKLPEPIFTPSTKAEEGHDENITFDQMKDIVGSELAEKIKDVSIRLYEKARDYALERGIIIADTKFEFGLDENGELVLIDEVLTPDSSRFWPLDEYKPGQPQKSFDKQYVRDYLEEIKWNKTPPAPTLPEDVIKNTIEKYKEAYNKLTGRTLSF